MIFWWLRCSGVFQGNSFSMFGCLLIDSEKNCTCKQERSNSTGNSLSICSSSCCYNTNTNMPSSSSSSSSLLSSSSSSTSIYIHIQYLYAYFVAYISLLLQNSCSKMKCKSVEVGCGFPGKTLAQQKMAESPTTRNLKI